MVATKWFYLFSSRALSTAESSFFSAVGLGNWTDEGVEEGLQNGIAKAGDSGRGGAEKRNYSCLGFPSVLVMFSFSFPGDFWCTSLAFV